MSNLNDTNIAWTRTTVNALWLGLLVWLNARFDWGFDLESPWAILIIGISAGVVWRASELLTKIPYLGYVLFGINKEPSYSPLPPPLGEPVPEDHNVRDLGITFLETLLIVVAIAVVLILIKLY